MVKVIVSILVFQLLVISSNANTVIVNASIKNCLPVNGYTIVNKVVMMQGTLCKVKREQAAGR